MRKSAGIIRVPVEEKNKTTGGAQWRRSVATLSGDAGLFDGRELNVDLNCIYLFFLF